MLEVKLLDPARWRTRTEPASRVVAYLEILPHRLRRHAGLGMLTPGEFEIGNQRTTAAETSERAAPRVHGHPTMMSEVAPRSAGVVLLPPPRP